MATFAKDPLVPMIVEDATLPRRVIIGLLLLVLVVLAFRIISPFIPSIAWSLILCYVTWPLHARLRERLGGRRNLAALLMTGLLAAALVIPMAWLVLLLEREMVALYQQLVQSLAAGPITLPESIRTLPILGREMQQLADRISETPDALREHLSHLLSLWRGEITDLLGGVGKNLAKLGFALLTAFFVYRDGEALLEQVKRGINQLIGERTGDYLQAAGATTRAVVFGIVLTAIAQGVLSGIGYWLFDVPSPVFLAAVTTVIALIPFGTPFAWGGAALWLLFNGDLWNAIGLALWGTLLVSWVDNIIRPLVISSATQIPFIIVMFGVLGGLASFGMVGLFIGPVVLAVVLAVWREWLGAHAEIR